MQMKEVDELEVAEVCIASGGYTSKALINWNLYDAWHDAFLIATIPPPPSSPEKREMFPIGMLTFKWFN